MNLGKSTSVLWKNSRDAELTETQEDRVDGHFVDCEEGAGNQVSSQCDGLVREREGGSKQISG